MKIRFRTQVMAVTTALVVATSLALGGALIYVSTSMMRHQYGVMGGATARVLAAQLEQKERILGRPSPVPPGGVGPQSLPPSDVIRPLPAGTPPSGAAPPRLPGGSESPFETDLREMADIVHATRISIVADGKIQTSVAPVGGASDDLTSADVTKMWQDLQSSAGKDLAILETSSCISIMAPLHGAEPNAATLGILVQLPRTPPKQLMAARAIVLTLVALAVVMAALLAAWSISRSISEPLSQLAHAAESFGRGTLDTPAQVRGPAETQYLGSVLNSMASSLTEHIRNLNDETRRREQLEGELRVAARLQQSLLPAPGLQKFGPVELLGWSETAVAVGGDFYDFRMLSRNRLAVVIGDAAGHGITAALLAAKCLSVLQALAEEFPDPGDLLSRTNALISEQFRGDGHFVTVFLGIVDLDGRRFSYSRAGHNPPLYASDGNGAPVAFNDQCGLPLGVKSGSTFESTTLDIAAGDTLLMYTDGITEMPDDSAQLFGTARLTELFAAQWRRPLPELLDALTRDVKRHGGDQPPHDDCTILLVRVS